MMHGLSGLVSPRKHALGERNVATLYADDAAFMTDTSAAVILGASRKSHFILLESLYNGTSCPVNCNVP